MKTVTALVFLLGVAAFAQESPLLKPNNATLAQNVNNSTANKCTCGYSYRPKFVPEARIIGGTDARPHEFPMIGALSYADTPGVVYCGSTVITKRHALSAGHCSPGPFRQANIVLAEHDTNATNDSDIITIPVERFIRHEEYNLNGYIENDIALLVLESEIPFGPIIGPACFPDVGFNLAGKKVRILGWGTMSFEGQKASILQKVDVNVVPMEQCRARYVGTTSKQLCTYTLRKDACQGDSGGPIIYYEPSTRRYTLVGVVSYGVECGTPGVPAINTDVLAYRAWILNKIAETDPSAFTCPNKKEV